MSDLRVFWACFGEQLSAFYPLFGLWENFQKERKNLVSEK